MLRAIEITGEQPGPKLLITGGVHGDEYEPMVACRKIAEALCPQAAGRYGCIHPGPLAAPHLCGQVTLIPCVNEPAFERGARTADDGLDLARICPGRPDGSVTERIAHALSERIRAADYYIDLHTGGVAYRIFPLSGYTLHPDPQVLDVQRRMARAFNLPVIWGTAPNLNGRSLSVARDAGVPAIYAEYEGGSHCHAAGVQAYVDGCLSVMSEFGMLAGKASASRVLYVSEDARDGSGHLQVKQPAAITGIFKPCVELGERVAAGRRIGDIFTVDGYEHAEVLAECAGVVIMLPGLPRVLAGQATAAIIEV